MVEGCEVGGEVGDVADVEFGDVIVVGDCWGSPVQDGGSGHPGFPFAGWDMENSLRGSVLRDSRRWGRRRTNICIRMICVLVVFIFVSRES
jgi:hypothetical protein